MKHPITGVPAPKFWRYYLSNDPAKGGYEGWAEIILCSTGMFAAVSDFDNYAFAWRAYGSDFREFICQTNPDYVASKLGQGHEKEYDGAATVGVVREELIQWRRHDEVRRGFARREWNLLSENDNLSTLRDFERWLSETEIEDACFYGRQRTKPMLHRFCHETLPRLQKLIREELAREAQESREDCSYTLT